MNSQPDLSIILPVYNGADSISQTLISISEQNITNAELLVIDDCSNDNLEAVLNSFKAKFKFNIVYARNKTNIGVHSSRLTGIQMAKGKWIGFVDADDTINQNMYSRMIKAGVDNKVDIVICGSDRISTSGKRLRNKVYFNRNQLVKDSIFERFCNLEFLSGVVWNKIYRRKVIKPFEHLYLPWRQDINEDYILNLGCFSRASSVYLLKERLYHYTHNPKSVTSSVKKDQRFVDIFMGFSIAVTIFPEMNSDEKLHIVELYRKQMKGSYLHIENVKQLTTYDEKLNAAINRVHDHYPIGLALLAARSRPLLRQAAKTILEVALERYRFSNN